MSKRNTISAFILLISAVATLCLLAAVITAQKGMNTTTGAPLKGVDVKLGRNPGGGAAARTLSSDSDGKINLGSLTPGSYSLEVIPPSKEKLAALGEGAEYFVVDVSGPSVVGGTQRMAWEVKKQKFVAPPAQSAQSAQSATARATTTPVYSAKFQFEITGSPAPVQIKIIKSHSNALNN
jgi:hypothetical protein